AEDDPLGVEGVDHAGDRATQRVRRRPDRAHRVALPGAGVREERGHGGVGAQAGPTGELEQRSLTEERLDATALAAVARRPGGVEGVVTDLPGVAVAAVHRETADDDARADTDATHHEHDVVDVPGVASLVLSQ